MVSNKDSNKILNKNPYQSYPQNSILENYYSTRSYSEPNYIVTLQVGADEKRFDEVCCTVHASDSNDAKMKALGKISVFGYKFVRIIDANPQAVHRKSREER